MSKAAPPLTPPTAMAAATVNIPAIALSAYSRDEDRAAALDAGFNRFLVKPIDPQEFVGVISQVAVGGVQPGAE